jgi:hypothetical protein
VWADEEYATARTELFLAALALHKALIAAETETFEHNLGALMDLLSADGGPPPEVALAAWQSFFLVVPVVRTAVENAGSLFAGLGRGSVGWLLAASAGRVAPQQMLGGLWRASHAVLAGDQRREEPAVILPWAGRQALAKALGAAGEQAPGPASAQRLADRTAGYGTWLPAVAAGNGHGDGIWVGAPLRIRHSDPATAPGVPATPGGPRTLPLPRIPGIASTLAIPRVVATGTGGSGTATGTGGSGTATRPDTAGSAVRRGAAVAATGPAAPAALGALGAPGIPGTPGTPGTPSGPDGGDEWDDGLLVFGGPERDALPPARRLALTLVTK